MGEAEEERMRLDDSFVSAQLQRASLADGAADDLPDEDVVLAEGGLTAESAQQLRRDVEMRVKAASEGTLQLDTSERSAAYGQEVQTHRHTCLSNPSAALILHTSPPPSSASSLHLVESAVL